MERLEDGLRDVISQKTGLFIPSFILSIFKAQYLIYEISALKY
jgi:hypothetical protein